MIGDEVLPAGFTTPEAPELQALLAVMAERGASTVVMEVSSHALELGRVDGIRFAVAAFTNLSQDHLDFHPDMEAYFAAKARLFDGRAQRAVVVVDDELGRADGRRSPGRRPDHGQHRSRSAPRALVGRPTFGTEADGSTRFRAIGPGVDVAAGCAIAGRYNVANALLALAILDAIGRRGRGRRAGDRRGDRAGAHGTHRGRASPTSPIVDYSHKPAAVASALAALRPLTDGRLIVVLGSGGDRDRGKRPLMGAGRGRGRRPRPHHRRQPALGGPGRDPRGPCSTARWRCRAAQRGEVREVAGRAAAIARRGRAAAAGRHRADRGQGTRDRARDRRRRPPVR